MSLMQCILFPVNAVLLLVSCGFMKLFMHTGLFALRAMAYIGLRVAAAMEWMEFEVAPILQRYAIWSLGVSELPDFMTNTVLPEEEEFQSQGLTKSSCEDFVTHLSDFLAGNLTDGAMLASLDIFGEELLATLKNAVEEDDKPEEPKAVCICGERLWNECDLKCEYLQNIKNSMREAIQKNVKDEKA